MHRLHLAHLDAVDLPAPAAKATGQVSADPFILRGEDARHARRVRRARPGEPAAVINGCGVIWTGVVIDAPTLGRDDLAVGIEHVASVPEPTRIDIAACAPKTGRLGDMIDMLAQVGASRWIPLITQRSGDPGRIRADKLERVAREAAKQCGRAWDLRIAEPMTLEDAIRGHPVLLAAHQYGTPAPNAFATLDGPAAGMENATDPRVLIGPEGGWSEAELAAMDAAGAVRLGLGPHVLRIETAAVVATAALRAWIDTHPHTATQE